MLGNYARLTVKVACCIYWRSVFLSVEYTVGNIIDPLPLHLSPGHSWVTTNIMSVWTERECKMFSFVPIFSSLCIFLIDSFNFCTNLCCSHISNIYYVIVYCNDLNHDVNPGLFLNSSIVILINAVIMV